MPYRLSYYDEAGSDIEEAKMWYHSQLPGLEKRFSKDIKHTAARVSSNPFAYAIRYKKIRIAYASVFPYSIHFYIDNARVVITGIVHNSRNPEFLNQRK
jgi:toxin ParE1/3/4